MATLIIGTGNLSEALKHNSRIENAIILSSREIIQNNEILVAQLDKFDTFNIIINCFQASDKFSPENSTSIIRQSIYNLTLIISIIDGYKHKINKIIYSSSSSVYGAASKGLCSEYQLVSPNNIRGVLKLTCEQLIKDFCLHCDIDYTLARIFNIYGGSDRFSIVKKLLDASNDNSLITLINNGAGVRDFIHVDDVSEVYANLLHVKNMPIVNVGSGIGFAVSEMVDIILRSGKSLNISHKENPNEIEQSIADITLLGTTIDTNRFNTLADFMSAYLHF